MPVGWDVNHKVSRTFGENSIFSNATTDRVSAFLGVQPAKDGQWCARVTKNKKPETFGAFDTEAEAARAFDAVALELDFEAAVTNF